MLEFNARSYISGCNDDKLHFLKIFIHQINSDSVYKETIRLLLTFDKKAPANTPMTRIVWVKYSVNDFETKGLLSTPHRMRFTWSQEMEKLFLNAVLKLGAHATPSFILKEMDVPGLTRNQVSSHLQKYRCKVRKSAISSPIYKLSVNYLLN